MMAHIPAFTLLSRKRKPESIPLVSPQNYPPAEGGPVQRQRPPADPAGPPLIRRVEMPHSKSTVTEDFYWLRYDITTELSGLREYAGFSINQIGRIAEKIARAIMKHRKFR